MVIRVVRCLRPALMEQGHNSGYGEIWSDAPDLESGVENDT